MIVKLTDHSALRAKTVVIITCFRSLQNYQKCLKPFLSNCEDFDKAIPSGYVRAHRYLCDVDIEGK